MTLREAGVSLIDCEHRTPPAADNGDGYPYVAIPQIREGRIEIGGARRISRDHFVEWTRKARPQPFDVVLSRRCNPGETGFVPPGMEFALGQNLVLLRADGTNLHPPFLRWLVRGTDWWEQIGTFLNVGAVFDSLKCADVPNFRLRIYGATVGYATWLGMELCANQACCALIPAEDAASFVFLLASSSLDAFQQQTRGSAQQNLSQTIAAELPTIVPPRAILGAFNQLAQPLLTKCLDHLRQSRTLAALRDALLPKLLSGEIRVGAAERLVEEVV